MMYEVKQTAKRKYTKSLTAASDAEIVAAVEGKLTARNQKGTIKQADMARLGRNGMPVGRPLGMTTGLPVFLALCYIFQQNEKAPNAKKLTDEQLAQWLRAEFPGRNTDYWDDIQRNRRKYNQGLLTRGMAPKFQSHRYDSGGQMIDAVYTRHKRKK